MTMKKIILAALTGTALLAAAPVFADNGRGGRQEFRGDHRGNHFQGHRVQRFHGRPVVVQRNVHRHYGYRPAVIHRPAVAYRPAVVYRDAYGHQILGGLILGTVIGAAIASNY